MANNITNRAPRGYGTCQAGVSEICRRVVAKQEIVYYKDIRMCLDCKAEFDKMYLEE